MPCDPIKMAKLDALLDAYLDMRAKYPDDEEDEPPCDPLVTYAAIL